MEPADELRGVRAVHSCLLGHGCQVTDSRVLWKAARDDAVLLGLHQRSQPVSAWYAQSSRFTCGCLLGQTQGVFWLASVSSPDSSRTADLWDSSFAISVHPSDR
jgi:hypothetical protein